VNAPGSKQQTKSIIAQRFGRVLIFMHREGTPTDEDWQSALELFGSQSLEQLRVLVFTDGSSPSHTQQARLSKVLGRAARTLPVAVISESTAVRFVASALALFLPRIRTFRPIELQQACAHLELDTLESRAATEFVQSQAPAPKQRASW
jgi:hypothetical protein